MKRLVFVLALLAAGAVHSHPMYLDTEKPIPELPTDVPLIQEFEAGSFLTMLEGDEFGPKYYRLEHGWVLNEMAFDALNRAVEKMAKTNAALKAENDSLVSQVDDVVKKANEKVAEANALSARHWLGVALFTVAGIGAGMVIGWALMK